MDQSLLYIQTHIIQIHFLDSTTLKPNRNFVKHVVYLYKGHCTKVHCVTASGPSRDKCKLNATPYYMQIQIDIKYHEETKLCSTVQIWLLGTALIMKKFVRYQSWSACISQ